MTIFDAAEAGDLVRIQELILKDRQCVNAWSEEGFTPLHLACWQKHLFAAQLLLTWGADVNATARDGRTPLHYAVHEGTPQESAPIIAILVANGANKSIRDAAGYTPAEWARIEMQNDAIQVLDLLE